MYELMVEGSFDAAHQLIGYEGPCENLHGHTWKVQVAVTGKKLNKLGMLIDFKEIKTVVNAIINKLDHKNLNDLTQFRKVNPSSENVATFIFAQLKGKFNKGIKLAKVTVYESPVTCASVTR
jgi:6-pyruvoyltetrahydropterin/6-carboxytetrahydropterin synthase